LMPEFVHPADDAVNAPIRRTKSRLQPLAVSV
jgi:hypothetical protein